MRQKILIRIYKNNMEKKFTCPVSMKIPTQEQYERDLKRPLLEMGYKEGNVHSFERLPYLCTNVNRENLYYSNLREEDKLNHNRYFIDHYNPELFLALAAMTDAEYGIRGEYWVIDSPYFKKQLAYKSIYVSPENITFVDDNGEIRHFPIMHLRKASKELLIKMFNKNEEKMEENQCINFIKMAYEKANDEQRRVLMELFPELDDNVFVKRFDSSELTDISKKLFGDENAMQIGANEDLEEYKGRCFWFDGDFFEKPIVEVNKGGNYILKLHKK